MNLPWPGSCQPCWPHLSSPLSFLHIMLSLFPSALPLLSCPARDPFPTVLSPSLFFILQVLSKVTLLSESSSGPGSPSCVIHYTPNILHHFTRLVSLKFLVQSFYVLKLSFARARLWPVLLTILCRCLAQC